MRGTASYVARYANRNASSSYSTSMQEAATGTRNTYGKVQGIRQLMQDEYGVKFYSTEDEANMISLPSRIEGRTDVLEELWEGKPVVTVLDLYANVGGDTLAFMKQALEAKRAINIVAVQLTDRQDNEKGLSRFDRLSKNIGAYADSVVKRAGKVHLVTMNTDVGDFIRTHLKSLHGFEKADLLYADPPWNLPDGFCLGKDCGTTANPSAPTLALVRRLQIEVFGPLQKVKYPVPELICIKAPTPFDEFKVVLFTTSPYLSGHVLLKTLPVRNRRGSICMYFHILVANSSAESGSHAQPSLSETGRLPFDPSAPAFVPL